MLSCQPNPQDPVGASPLKLYRDEPKVEAAAADQVTDMLQ